MFVIKIFQNINCYFAGLRVVQLVAPIQKPMLGDGHDRIKAAHLVLQSLRHKDL
jgi:hypothetical protein